MERAVIKTAMSSCQWKTLAALLLVEEKTFNINIELS